MSKLLGGSQSEPVRSFTHGFFHSGVKATQFRVARQEFLRFLPAFDSTKEGTEFYDPSWMPYRSTDTGPDAPVDPDTKTPAFTSWYFVVRGYAFLGKSMETFLSPLTKYPTRLPPGVDPLHDIRNYLYKSEDPMLKPLTESQGPKAGAAAPKARVFMMCNVLLMTDLASRTTENQIGIFTGLALTDLKDKLARRTGRNDEIISPEWEDFLYGDVTHPVQGLAATIKETPMESNPSIKYAGINFSEVVGRLDGMQKWPLDPSSTEGQAALEGRYKIDDTDTVTKIWTYDQILDTLVQEGSIPHEIIEKACSQHAENGIPAPSGTSKSATYSIPSQVAPTNSAPTAGFAYPKETMENPVSKQECVEEAIPVAEAVKTKVTAALIPEDKVEESKAASETTTPAPENKGGDSQDADKARYEELASKFRENPNNLQSEELPEFFNLCSKLGVSPQ